MPMLIDARRTIEAAGNKPKQIEEFAGRLSSGQGNVSVARMVSPAGWEKPAQQPEFDEITVVLRDLGIFHWTRWKTCTVAAVPLANDHGQGGGST